MLDIKWIKENKQKFIILLQKRNIEINIEALIELDTERRKLLTLIQRFQHSKNLKSKLLSKMRGTTNRELADIKRDIEHISDKLSELENTSSNCNKKIQSLMDVIPNILDDDLMNDQFSNQSKLIKKSSNFTTSYFNTEHHKIALELGMIDYKQTAIFSGSRFVTLKNQLAQLSRALINFMLDTHTNENKFEEISPPVLVKNLAMYNAGQLPKFDSDSYLTNDNKLRLIPTGEVPLLNMVAGLIFKKEELPIRYVAYTECFRLEAGSAGKDTKGMMRNHQFAKVELVSITIQEESHIEHEYILNSAEEILKRLELPYQIIRLSSEDTAFTASKTYDLEVWFPSQNKYREVSSVSNCLDFQARRMLTKYKDNQSTKFVHTLNGSGLAIGRIIAAILENYQNSDGSITIPEALKPYMKYKNKISLDI
ncbi:serine--tRNA ligase [Rickettsia endosymbiont of Cardiosporidium cionae]|uniref:serine--tRNA ligase n=1 Tax=Rickettsia endosymbiont of Cardiosporidium cionae TaxID=2777155 RepID=UPI001894FA78|nr:serine--tRNA ligase [Rickettsia endosymbiont of Cardiosporidium cionae]KAF8818133.1 serine--tRNA ligase [Rickettsia endosymbiont of Cardiosporidium cionae]